MHLILGLLAASLFGADRPAPAAAPFITYDLKVLDMVGLEWRSTFYPELQSVARRGVATAWTAPKGTVAKLAAKANKVVSAPRSAASSLGKSTIFYTKSQAIVADFDRHADGPVNHASYVAFEPKLETATEGNSVTFSGRKIDQGVLTEVTIEDKQVIAVHAVTLTEATESGAGAPAKLNAKLQIPETIQAQVSGEWLIPNDGVLVVSLGVHTAADANGKAVVRERLVLLEARAVEGQTARVSSQLMKVNFPFPVVPRSTIPMPVAIVPSRSLPQGLSASGVPVPLPPLPDDVHVPPTALPGSSEPCATPQGKDFPVGDPIPSPFPTPTRDPSSRQAGYRGEPGCCDLDDDRPLLDRPSASADDLKAKVIRFPLPGKAGTWIEIRATAHPVASDHAPTPPPYPTPE